MTRRRWGALLLWMGCAACAAALRADVPAPSQPAALTAGGNIDLPAYRARLARLIQLVDSCSQSMDSVHCDKKQVGGVDRVLLAGSAVPREVHFDWLSEVLSRASAAKPAAAPPDRSVSAKPLSTPDSPPTPKELLAAARLHLMADLAATGGASAGPQAAPGHPAQHQQVHAILSQSEFDSVQPPSPGQRALEAFLNWLNDRLNRMSVGHASGWVTLVLEWMLIIAVSTGLAWWLIRGTKRERWRLESPGGPRDAPSLRDWQIWLAEADAFAAQGHWREAVHSVYWAAISRLESRGLWPVDQARTPREYLELVTQADPRRTALVALTRTFERIWYGYRDAAERDYRSAVQLIEKLTA